MSLRKLLHILPIMAAMSGASFDRRVSPPDPNAGKYDPTKTNQRTWIIDGVEVVAATRKAAIKKAKKIRG